MDGTTDLKIVWFSKTFIDINLDTATYIEMCKELANLGNRIVLVTSYQEHKNEVIINENFTHLLIRNKMKPLMNSIIYLKVIIKLPLILKNFQPDIITLEWPIWYISIPLLILKRLSVRKFKLCMDIRTEPVSARGIQLFVNSLNYKLSLFLGRYLFDGLTVISPYLKKKLMKKYNIASEKIGVWSSGVDIHHFSNKFNRVDQNKFVVLYHGVIAVGRGIENVLLSLKYVIPVVPNIHLILVGKNDISKVLNEIILKDNIKDYVTIRERVEYSQIPEILANCDVGIIPLPDIEWWRPSSPLKLMEYLSMGKPVILTDIIAHRNVIGNCKCGFFAGKGQPEDFAEQIIRTYRMKDCLKRIGEEGRLIVENNFTWSRQAKEMMDFYNNLKQD